MKASSSILKKNNKSKPQHQKMKKIKMIQTKVLNNKMKRRN